MGALRPKKATAGRRNALGALLTERLQTSSQAILKLGRVLDTAEIDFGVGYGALVRAMTSSFVTTIEHHGRSVA